jgi:hypothetical protein
VSAIALLYEMSALYQEKTSNTDVILTNTDVILMNTDGILSNTDGILTLHLSLLTNKPALTHL